MSVQEERELRERLGGLLDGIEPRTAPVARAVRQGRGIRMRRWAAAGAGLAVIVAAAVLVPAALHRHSAPGPAARVSFTVTVNPPGKDAQRGLISWGTQDGHPWRIVLSGSGDMIAAGGSGHDPLPGLRSSSAPDAVSLAGNDTGRTGGTRLFAGPVRADVTRVVLILPGRTVLTLTPIRYGGGRFVGVVIPSGVPVLRGVAYHGSRELAYSVPYERATLATWWLPGRAGPDRFTKTIGAGVIAGHEWRVTAQFGPWGYCYALPGDSTCGPVPQPSPVRQPLRLIACGSSPPGISAPTVGMAAVRTDIRQVALTFSNGVTQRLATVDVLGARLLAYAYQSGHRIVRMTEYGAGGRVVGTAPASEICQ